MLSCSFINSAVMTIRQFLFLGAALMSISAAAHNPSWIRFNSISPDGKQIAFSYQGDIFVVSSQGGQARQLTSNAAYDSTPMWTRDGSGIVFSSYREGSRDLYLTSVEGGTPKRLTTLPGNETLLAVLDDGSVLFSTYISALQSDEFRDWPGGSQLYRTDLSGSAPRLESSLSLSALSVNGSGVVLYEDYKGYEDPLRKHHTSSVTRDIWAYSPPAIQKKGSSARSLICADGSFRKLSDYKGEDRNPVFAPDGDTFYFLSERDGKTSNVFRSSVSGSGECVQLTFEEKNPVRFLSISDEGTLAYSCNGSLYTLREGEQSRKVEVSLLRDPSVKSVQKTTLSSGASSMAVSPDGKEIALVVRGDVYVTSADYRTTRRITNTAEQERNVDFSADGRELYYSSERDGHWAVYKTSLVRKEDKLFTYATDFKEQRVSPAGQTCFQPDVSPDGKWVAYYKDRTSLVIQSTDSDKIKVLFEGVNYSYSDGDQGFEWSPDSRHILCNWQKDGGWNNQDVALVDIESGEITNLTRSGYSDGSFRWALGGKAMTWESDKNGYRSHGSWGSEGDIYVMFFDPETMTRFKMSKEEKEIEKMYKSSRELKKEEKQEKKDSLNAKKNKTEKVELTLEGREYRIVRLTPHSNMLGDHYLSEDGQKLYFTQRLERGYDLCVMDLEEGSVRVLSKGVSGSFTPSADGKSLYIFSGRGISKLSLPSGKSETISYSAEFEYKPKQEREYMFEHIWKQVQEKFYVQDLHGTDWQYYHDNYAAFLDDIDNNFDFQDLLSEMLGELNGSHTGARYRYPSSRNMAYLGALYDTSWTSDGLKIKEILPSGVLQNADGGIKAGDVILAIDGVDIKAGDDWTLLLADKAGKQIKLSVQKQSGSLLGGKSTVELFVKGAASDSEPMYRRWVAQREEMVESLSGGRIGYVHVKGMDSESFREVFSNALGKYRNCDALIVDTRHNGGGWLHDDIVTFLSGKLYNQYIPRGQFIGNEPFTKWTKPSCMLIGEDNYSDASGTPYAYQKLGIGKLVGAPVPGTMTAVWWETLLDSSLVFGIPQVGTWSVEEQCFIENHQIEPDVEVYNDPASLLAGEDRQLEAAVRLMLEQCSK